MTKKLGRIQVEVLAALKRHGNWSRGCGWVWTTPLATERMLDRLVARCAVRKYTITSVSGLTVERYTIAQPPQGEPK